MENWKYLVVDQENSGVLYSAPTLSNALNVTGGILNTSVVQIPLHRKYFSPLAIYDFQNDMLETFDGRQVRPLKKEHVSEKFLKRRGEASLRGQYLESIEMLFQLGREKASLSYPAEIAAEIDIEIGRCQPEKNIFTQAIHEYASVQQIDPSVAFEELNFLIKGARLVKIRNFGLYRKYVHVINTCPLEDLEKNYQRAIDEVFHNAQI